MLSLIVNNVVVAPQDPNPLGCWMMNFDARSGLDCWYMFFPVELLSLSVVIVIDE